jgi:hypothetical protein
MNNFANGVSELWAGYHCGLAELDQLSGLMRGINSPRCPAKFSEPDGQEQQRQAQPRTAALPCWSGSAEVLECRFVPATLDTAKEALELQGTEDRKGRPDDGERKPIEPIKKTIHRPLLRINRSAQPATSISLAKIGSRVSFMMACWASCLA